MMSYDAIMISSEVYISTLASTGGPRSRTIVSYSPSSSHLAERSLSHPTPDGLNGWEHCLER